jgi:hypothetical protein
MSFANKLGPSYEAVRAQARIKTIKVTLNDVECELKIRVPVKREMEELTSSITNPIDSVVEEIYKNLSDPLVKTIKEADDEFLKVLNAESEKIKILDNDLIVDGNSIRQIAQMTAIWQSQVEKYFALIQTSTGEPVTESFDEIAEEFPDVAIREIVNKIDSAIRPNFKDTKKN